MSAIILIDSCTLLVNLKNKVTNSSFEVSGIAIKNDKNLLKLLNLFSKKVVKQLDLAQICGCAIVSRCLFLKDKYFKIKIVNCDNTIYRLNLARFNRTFN